MNAPKITRAWLCLLAAIAGVFIHSAAAAEETKPAQRPNIIFILADDLSYGDLSCFGQKHFSTPNIDRLASEGRVFANAYAAGSWCAPSRTGLLTGRNWSKAAPAANSEGKKKFCPTVAELLKTAGYSTCALGKWHMQEGGNNWVHARTLEELEKHKKDTVWSQMPWNRGFDVCRIGYRLGDNPYYPHGLEYGDNQEISLQQNHRIEYTYLYKYFKEGGSLFNAEGRYVDASGSSDLRYSEDLYRNEALTFMRANKDKPFFLYYATSLMHGPLAVPSLGRFKDMPKEWTSPHKFWAAMVETLDASVGLILDEVKKLGIEKNTIICFTSDNGYSAWGYFGRSNWQDDPVFQNKGPWNRGKFVNTNGGLIVPFIAWGPGRIPAGKTGRAINFYDLMATAGELSGAKLPGPTDGASFVPLLEGRDQDQPVRATMVWKGTRNERMKADPWGPEEKVPGKTQPLIPDSVLLDEKWYAIGLHEIPAERAPTPPPRALHLFDVTADPGMAQDLATSRTDLCERALKALR
jgi:arylsulfatase A-like enzyme